MMISELVRVQIINLVRDLWECRFTCQQSLPVLSSHYAVLMVDYQSVSATSELHLWWWTMLGKHTQPEWRKQTIMISNNYPSVPGQKGHPKRTIKDTNKKAQYYVKSQWTRQYREHKLYCIVVSPSFGDIHVWERNKGGYRWANKNSKVLQTSQPPLFHSQ